MLILIFFWSKMFESHYLFEFNPYKLIENIVDESYVCINRMQILNGSETLHSLKSIVRKITFNAFSYAAY